MSRYPCLRWNGYISNTNGCSNQDCFRRMAIQMDTRMIASAEWQMKRRAVYIWDSKKHDASLWLRFSLKPKLLTWNLIFSTLALTFKSSQTVKERTLRWIETNLQLYNWKQQKKRGWSRRICMQDSMGKKKDRFANLTFVWTKQVKKSPVPPPPHPRARAARPRPHPLPSWILPWPKLLEIENCYPLMELNHLDLPEIGSKKKTVIPWPQVWSLYLQINFFFNEIWNFQSHSPAIQTACCRRESHTPSKEASQLHQHQHPSA